MLNNIRIEQIKIEYIGLLKNIKSFPDNSSQKQRAKKELGKYLESVRDRFGQEIVDKVAGKIEPKPQEPTVLIICTICNVEVNVKNMSHHIKKRHS